MKVKDCMTRNVTLADPEHTIREAAKLMDQLDTGVLPVGADDRLVGMITDRDIALRAVGMGKGPETPVREVMTTEVKYCFQDESVEHVAQNMGDIQIRRLPVMDRDRRLVGIVSLGDLAMHSGDTSSKVIGRALGDVSRHLDQQAH